MSCTHFQLGARGSLAIMRKGHTLIFLWPDEVARLKPLLAQPTPAKNTFRSLSAGKALPAEVLLAADGCVLLRFAFEVQGFEGVELDVKHANDLRAVLGILTPREGETFEAMAWSIGESYGHPAARAASVASSAMAARMLASGRVEVPGV
ncbi:MAG TPA: hypothetical protein VIV12_01500 [Streptosporangiaceae bacterium]